MEEPEKAKRKYSKTDVLLLEQSQTMLDNFLDDVAAFTADYPEMDADYATDWQEAINNADNAPDDEQVLGDQKQKTIMVTDTMVISQNAYGKLTTYLKLIYKDKQKPVLEHFGYARYRKSRKNQLRLKELMDLAYERANSATYKPALIAKGFPQTDIDGLHTLALQMETTNQVQEKSKTDRPEVRQSRVTLHNSVWDTMVEVNIASSVVFAGDYAHQQHYLLYPERGNGGTVLQTIQSLIAAMALKAEGALPAGALRMRMTIIAGGPIEFGLSADAGLTFNGNTTTLGAAGQTITYLIADFASAGNIILAHNQHPTLQGEYKIEILG